MRFYFTLHPGDMMRTRIPEGAHVMLVASAHWDGIRQRFAIRRPPADWIASLTIDSGGFTAAKRWGEYPWTPEQYIDFIREESRDVTLDFCAAMDYACEREVNRETLATNRERIRASIENDARLRELAPDLPWLSVLQGNTLKERREDVTIRRDVDLLSPYLGIGSICGRPAAQAAEVIRFYADLLPQTRFHGFGLDVRTLDQGDDVALRMQSWDSASWNWPAGTTGQRLLRRRSDETYSTYTGRVGQAYAARTINPRIYRPRQMAFGDQALIEVRG